MAVLGHLLAVPFDVLQPFFQLQAAAEHGDALAGLLQRLAKLGAAGVGQVRGQLLLQILGLAVGLLRARPWRPARVWSRPARPGPGRAACAARSARSGVNSGISSGFRPSFSQRARKSACSSSSLLAQPRDLASSEVEPGRVFADRFDAAGVRADLAIDRLGRRLLPSAAAAGA